MKLQESYLNYITGSGPKEGRLTIAPGWFQLWPNGQIEELNKAYHTADWIPGYIGFGSDGGGEMLAFDPLSRIVRIPFIPMRMNDAVVVADSWEEFEKAMER